MTVMHLEKYWAGMMVIGWVVLKVVPLVALLDFENVGWKVYMMV